MSVQDILKLGNDAFDLGQYEDAVKHFATIADEDLDAQIMLPLSYFRLGCQVSTRASRSEKTEDLVRGQQAAIKILDLAVRSAMRVIRNYAPDNSVCGTAASLIAQSLELQYTLVALGLTTAYRMTSTTTTIEQTMLNGTVLWEEIIGTEINSSVSLTSFDMRDYSVFGPDNKTLRVQAECEKILQNTVQVATIVEMMGREADAHMIRAAVACAMADSEGGIRNMVMAAQWFVARGKELAQASMDAETYNDWVAVHTPTIDTCAELSQKYAALLRSFRKEGQRPYLARFYQNASQAPAMESCAAYMQEQEINRTIDPVVGKGDFFQMFLSVFAQATTNKIIPMIVFSSIISLFCGGLFHVFSQDIGLFGKIFGIIWVVVTALLTLIRTVKNGDEFRSKQTRFLYTCINFGIVLVFSINFFVGIILFIVLKILSKKFK